MTRITATMTMFALLLMSEAADAAQIRVACVGYMEADAIYEEAMAATEPRSWADSLSWKLTGLPRPIHEAREAAELERWRDYQKAYDGPRSDVASVMAELISDDQFRCMMEKLGIDENGQ